MALSMPERDSLSGPDNAWRRMGKGNNLMDITGVLIFDGQVTYEEMIERLEERLLRFDRFNQRIVGRNRRILRPYWEPVDGFDVRNHVYDIRLPEPAGKDTFQDFIGKLMSRPLDERRPLWELYLLGDAGPGDGNAAAIRINHSVGDGFALLYVLLGLVDNPSDLEFPIGGISAPPTPGEKESTPADAAENAGANAAEKEPAASLPETGEEDPDKAIEEFRDHTSISGILNAVKVGGRAVSTLFELLTRDDEPDTSLFGELGPTKRAAWTRQIDIDRVKEVGHAHDATLNDVLLAVAAGGIGRVLEERGELQEGLELRCTIPVNLKPMEERTESLGNYFGLVFAPIPVGTKDLNERIDIVHDQMDAQKAGIEAFIMYKLLQLSGMLPEAVQNTAMKIFEERSTSVVTNVPGPANTARFTGTDINDVIFWVPQGNDVGLGISIISYNGTVRIGVASDANLLSNPQKMTESFEKELDTLFEELDD